MAVDRQRDVLIGMSGVNYFSLPYRIIAIAGTLNEYILREISVRAKGSSPKLGQAGREDREIGRGA